MLLAGVPLFSSRADVILLSRVILLSVSWGDNIQLLQTVRRSAIVEPKSEHSRQLGTK